MPMKSDYVSARYRWLIEPLKERIPDIEILIEDYGDTAWLASREFNKRFPLRLADRMPEPGGELDCMEGWDFMDHARKHGFDLASAIDIFEARFRSQL